MFQVVQHSTWMNLILYQEGTEGNPNQPRPGHTSPGRHFKPSLGSASCPHIHVQGRGLDGRFSLWAGACWWARGYQVVLSRSHLRTDWQWRNTIPEVLCSVPVWTDGCQVVGCLRPWWRSVQRVVGVCLGGSCLGSEKHHRQLTGALRIPAGLPGICSQGSSRDCRQEPVLRALLHTPAREAGAPHQQYSPGSAQCECHVGGALIPRGFWIPEPRWPTTGSLLESCSQRNLTLSAL